MYTYHDHDTYTYTYHGHDTYNIYYIAIAMYMIMVMVRIAFQIIVMGVLVALIMPYACVHVLDTLTQRGACP